VDRRPNPIYQHGTQVYWQELKQQLDKYRRDDPRTTPQLAVPVTITEHLQRLHQHDTAIHGFCPHREAKADLINIAFYYLLRVGEYTKPRSTRTNTKPFAVHSITFRTKEGNLIPNTSSLAVLLTAHEATIRMPNQKNGVKGQCITQQCTGTTYSPVKSLARRVHHILSNGGPPSLPIFHFKHPFFASWRMVTAQQINTTLKAAAKDIGLYGYGYTPSDVSSHSLRAGGAMAMHLNGIAPLTIQKMGRWRSQTFTMYIHEQISAFAAGLSVKMSNEVPFRHIAGPHTTDPA